MANASNAPVAQLDRVPGYELGGREFESLRARQTKKNAGLAPAFFLCFQRYLLVRFLAKGRSRTAIRRCTRKAGHHAIASYNGSVRNSGYAFDSAISSKIFAACS